MLLLITGGSMSSPQKTKPTHIVQDVILPRKTNCLLFTLVI